jgi:hypothetical protein
MDLPDAHEKNVAARLASPIYNPQLGHSLCELMVATLSLLPCGVTNPGDG